MPDAIEMKRPGESPGKAARFGPRAASPVRHGLALTWAQEGMYSGLSTPCKSA